MNNSAPPEMALQKSKSEETPKSKSRYSRLRSERGARGRAASPQNDGESAPPRRPVPRISISTLKQGRMVDADEDSATKSPRQRVGREDSEPRSPRFLSPAPRSPRTVASILQQRNRNRSSRDSTRRAAGKDEDAMVHATSAPNIDETSDSARSDPVIRLSSAPIVHSISAPANGDNLLRVNSGGSKTKWAPELSVVPSQSLEAASESVTSYREQVMSSKPSDGAN